MNQSNENENEKFKSLIDIVSDSAARKRIEAMDSYCYRAFETARSKGWHDVERETGTMLALIHSEVSEALEADRRGDDEHFAEELADICIRVFDLCGARGINLGMAIEAKMNKNLGRSHMHGGKKY